MPIVDTIITVQNRAAASGVLMRLFPVLRKVAWIVIMLSLLIETGCISRSHKSVTIIIKGVENGRTYPPGTVLKPMIQVEPKTARIALQVYLNGLPFALGTTIQEPGEYQLRVEARGNGVHKAELVYFSILTRVNVKTVKWSFRPYPDGTADLEAVLVMLNPPVSVNQLSPSSCLLHLWIQLESTQSLKVVQKVVLELERMVHLKNRTTGHIEGTLLYFKANRDSFKATQLVFDEKYPAHLKGVFYGSVLKPFEERIYISNRNSRNNSLIRDLVKRYTIDLDGGVLGKPLPEGVDTIDKAL